MKYVFNKLSKFDSQRAIDSSDNHNLKGILLDLLDSLSGNDNQIRSLTNREVNLELRVNEGEKYSSRIVLPLTIYLSQPQVIPRTTKHATF